MIVRQIVTEYDDILGLVARRAAPPDLLASASRPVRWRCRTEQEIVACGASRCCPCGGRPRWASSRRGPSS